MNMEATFSALKGYIDCEISVLNGKVDLFIESLKEAMERTLWKKELLAKNNIIKSLLKTLEVASEALMNCKEKQQDQHKLPKCSLQTADSTIS